MANENTVNNQVSFSFDEIEGLKSRVETLKARREELAEIYKSAYAEYKELGEELKPIQRKLNAVAYLTVETKQKSVALSATMISRLYRKDKSDKFIVSGKVIFGIAKLVLNDDEWKNYVGRPAPTPEKLESWQVRNAEMLDTVNYKRHYMLHAIARKCSVEDGELMVRLADNVTVVLFEDVEREASK